VAAKTLIENVYRKYRQYKQRSLAAANPRRLPLKIAAMGAEHNNCGLIGQDHAHASSLIPKKLAPAKAGVADFLDKILRTLQVSGEKGDRKRL
jgi:hypothetical protein